MIDRAENYEEKRKTEKAGGNDDLRADFVTGLPNGGRDEGWQSEG